MALLSHAVFHSLSLICPSYVLSLLVFFLYGAAPVRAYSFSRDDSDHRVSRIPWVFGFFYPVWLVYTAMNLSTTTEAFANSAYIVANLGFLIAFSSIPLWLIFFGSIWPAKASK